MSEGGSVSWIAVTDQALRSAVDVVEGQRQVSNLQDAAANLPELVADFTAIAEAAAVVRPFGWDGRSPSPEVWESLRQAAETLDNRPVTTALRGLERFRSDVKADLTDFWRHHASERLGNVGDLQVLAGTLKGVDGVAELSGELESSLGELARSQDQLPSRQSVEFLSRAESVFRDLQDSLQPEAVRQFLSAVARGGATLGLLGDEVVAWLSDHNAVGRFKIVAGQPSEAVND